MKNAFDEVDLESLRFQDDGIIPNSRLPVLLYRNAFSGTKIGQAMQEALAKNGWGGIWRNGVYDFHHYHSTAHEFLGVLEGSAALLVGGRLGEVLRLSAGDALVLPAGTGHKCEEATPDFKILGAYPAGQDWDLCRGEPGERPTVLENIQRLALPLRDPLYGPEGPLLREWR